MAKAETIERRWFVIDAANKPLGKTAVEAATILRGKHRPEFTPHVDCGEFVIIINADKAVLTGNKLEDKYYHHHSGYIGGLKSVQYKTLMATKPELAMVKRNFFAVVIGFAGTQSNNFEFLGFFFGSIGDDDSTFDLFCMLHGIPRR